MIQSIESVRDELEKRGRPILVGVSDGLIEERMLVNAFHPRPRIYFMDYVKAHPRGLIFPETFCKRHLITQPVSVRKEGLDTGDIQFDHPDYLENEWMSGFNPDFTSWFLFRVKGSTTAINQTLFTSFSKLVHWTFDLAIAKGYSIVEVSTRYMLYSSKSRASGVVLKGDLVELQKDFNVYVHLIPDIAFYSLHDVLEPEEPIKDLDDLDVEDPVLDLHPDLLAMFSDFEEP